ncbi:MAG TPA: hypothetical protein VFI10_01460 [Gaiellaceae bacterium]|jgi:hypothetical protein|nr:hypothetical protein [Gaiellaceae bacterium]
MTDAVQRRPIPLGLALVVAVLSALVTLAVTGPHAHAATHDHAATAKSFALQTSMRGLWDDHVTWTRLAIISLTTDSPDTKATVARLLRNQADIGNAIKPFYGAAAGTKLTSLLRQHILIAADLIAAAKNGDRAATTKQAARWTANANQMAAFLAGANPAWKLGAMKAMFHDHLRLTTDEVLARLNGTWAADVKAYDEIVRQARHMADMLSDGIVDQFPARFS